MRTPSLLSRLCRPAFVAALSALLPLAALAQVTEGSASNGSTTEGSTSNGSTTEGSASNGSTTEGSASNGGGTTSYDAPNNYDLSGGTVTLATAILNGGTVSNGTIDASAAIMGYSGSVTANLTGAATLNKSTADTLILAGANSYSGGTGINAGTLQIGNGGTLGNLPGNVANNATLVFNRSDAIGYSGVISGSGNVTQAGSGTLTLSGANSYTGNTDVTAGTLLVNGSLGATMTNVAFGATLGGAGSIGGATTVESGGILAPGDSVGTLTFTNGLTLNAGAVLNFDLGTTSDLIAVTGGVLTSPGAGTVTVNLADAGGFGAATYTLFSFSGAQLSGFDLADFTLGTTPGGWNYAFDLTADSLQLTVTASAVPEPATYAAMIGAFALGLALVRRRMRAQP